MDRKKLKKGLLTLLQILTMLGLTFAAGILLLRYCKHGEDAASGNVWMTDDKAGAQSAGRLIRVRIMGSDFTADLHTELQFTSQEDFTVAERIREGYELTSSEDAGKEAPESGSALLKEALLKSSEWSGERVTELYVRPEDMEEREVLILEPTGALPISVENLSRSEGAPRYYGTLYVWREGDALALLNVLPLETYLYGVVSSEMPSAYPMEAQKAQAVCARTYAVNCMAEGEPETLAADVTDSVSDQVYNNYSMTEASKQAVDETAGEILRLGDIQYYSTSCLSENRRDLDSDAAFADFLGEDVEDGAEYGSRWLRWESEVSEEELLDIIKAYVEESSPGTWTQPEKGGTLALTVNERRGDGQVLSLSALCGGTEYTAEGEYEVRKMLGASQTVFTLTDGSQASGMELLPSAFFCIESATGEQGGLGYFLIRGGGYGHGNGMSQCGAAALAQKGMDYREIISYYYNMTDNV